MSEISRSECPEFYSASFLHSSFLPLSSGNGQNKWFRGKMVEISAMYQKFLDQNIQNFIPHLFYIHHFSLWAAERAKTKNFGEIGRNFCNMPEISRSVYPKVCSASFSYSSFFHGSSRRCQIKKMGGDLAEIFHGSRKFLAQKVRKKIWTYNAFTILL